MPIKDLFESSEHSTINIIVDSMSAQNKKVFIYISVNKDFMKNRCGPPGLDRFALGPENARS